MDASKRIVRQAKLPKLLAKDPFLTDEQLAEKLNVSVPTIRLDRTYLGIPELRERTRLMAETAQTKLKAIAKKDIVGDLISLELNKSAISTLTITPDMVLEKSGVTRGHFMFAMADTLALALVDAEVALTGVGNVKYKVPVYAGATLVAKADVTNRRKDKFFIRVLINNDKIEVFRAKFVVVALSGERKREA
jgi:acyl-coenzyme A thioesterase PaaI-like protein